MKSPYQELTHRNSQLRKDHANGIGGKELAKKYGITRTRVYQILGPVTPQPEPQPTPPRKS